LWWAFAQHSGYLTLITLIQAFLRRTNVGAAAAAFSTRLCDMKYVCIVFHETGLNFQ
jgi:hypothetical protein